MVTLRLGIAPSGEGSRGRRDAFRTWMQEGGQVPVRARDKDADIYLVDLDSIFPALVALRELGIAPTEFRVELEHSRSRTRETTALAQQRRVAAIATALLTVNDLDQMGHFAAGNDLRLVVEALLLLLHTAQQELAASAPACWEAISAD
jgi:hypothetical protein